MKTCDHSILIAFPELRGQKRNRGDPRQYPDPESASPLSKCPRRLICAAVEPCISGKKNHRLFRADSLADAGAFLAAMFGRGPFWQAYTGVLIRENLLPLAAASAFAFLPTRRKPAADLLRQVLLLLAFSLSIVYMINGTYNPFIYFNF